MSVLRLNEFTALPGQFEALTAQFEAILPIIRACEGCESSSSSSAGLSSDHPRLRGL